MSSHFPLSLPSGYRVSTAPLADHSAKDIQRHREQRSQHERARYAVFERQPPEPALRAALERFDPGIPDTSEDVLAHVARAYHLDDIQFHSMGDKESWISQLFSLKQHRVLTIWFSFDHLSLSARDGGVYLEISPKPGHDIPPLPEWLQIPCIVTTSHFPSADVANPKIENGTEMKDSDGNYVGTLGTIMSATRDRQPGQLYVALTAGLIIPNGAYHVLVNNPATGADSPLEISHTSRRLQDKRIQLAEDKPEFSVKLRFSLSHRI